MWPKILISDTVMCIFRLFFDMADLRCQLTTCVLLCTFVPKKSEKK